ncbi:MAG: hypothetical protein JXR78_01460 [Victivallales bacterium]|nr:hypothetical protein [Victivallales bacterium]
MYLFKLVSCFTLMAAVIFPVSAASDYPLRDKVECTPRAGMPNFIAKLNAGKEVIIGYLGGSITAQDGWRVLSRKWFQKEYPKAKVKEIHAAIGGTGSNLGVFRLEHDVLKYKPDLLFVEFAVNDAGAQPENIKKAMEGIVRKTWKMYPDCDICFVYTITFRDIEQLNKGKMKRSASAMEEVADYYHIPSIHLGLEVAKLVKEGKVDMKAQKVEMTRVSGDELNEKSVMPIGKDGKIPFSKDGVHPYTDTGHTFYLNAIVRSMPDIIKAGSSPVAHKVGKPMLTDNWENAGMYPLSDAKMSGKWTPTADSLAQRFGKRMPKLWKGEPGAELEFKFTGTKVAIYDLLGPDCGNLEIILDGKKRIVKRIDGYCTYHRLAILSVGDKLPNQEHTVVIKVLGDKLDKNNVLFERNRADLEKNPQKYEGANWYAGGIFVISELKK